LYFSNASVVIIASPWTSNISPFEVFKGIDFIVLTCAVTTSPVSPFPLVAATSIIPSSLYVKLIVNPSNFFVITYLNGGKFSSLEFISFTNLIFLLCQSSISLILCALSKLQSLALWVYLENPCKTTSPTLCVGEYGST